MTIEEEEEEEVYVNQAPLRNNQSDF